MRGLLAAFTLLLLWAGPARAAGELVEVAPGVSLYVERIGSGRNVVIVPGGFLYGDAVRALARPDRTLVLYDMRNRGRSSRVVQDERITIQADVTDLEAVRRHVGAERASLIGFSYLGLMVMLYAVEHPATVDRVVQLGPVAIRWDTAFPRDLVWDDPAPVIPRDAEDELRRLREAGMDRSAPRDFCLRADRLRNLLLVAEPRNAARFDVTARCAMENEWPVNLARHFDLHFTRSVQPLQPPRDALAALRIPVLTVHGTMDRNAPFAGGVEWAMTLADARLLIVRRAAHSIWIDHPGIFEPIGRFLAGEWPAEAIRVSGWDDVRARLPGGLGAE